jgi:hypothetical protein
VLAAIRWEDEVTADDTRPPKNDGNGVNPLGSRPDGEPADPDTSNDDFGSVGVLGSKRPDLTLLIPYRFLRCGIVIAAVMLFVSDGVEIGRTSCAQLGQGLLPLAGSHDVYRGADGGGAVLRHPCRVTTISRKSA